MAVDFSVFNRENGHWDIVDDTLGQRVFSIRGVTGEVLVYDERHSPGIITVRPPMKFKSVTAGMTWIIDQLMFHGE